MKPLQFQPLGAGNYSTTAFGLMKNVATRLPDGTLTKPKLVNQWVTCRDTFQNFDSNEMQKHGFFITMNKQIDFCTFMARIEDTLNIPQSVYQKTEYEWITHCKPSPWWFTMRIRKSFYSLILRCAFYYDLAKDNFEEAIYNLYAFARQSKTAVRKFLKGYTHYEFFAADSNDHWFRQFVIQNYHTGESTEDTIHIRNMKPGKEAIAKKAYEIWLQTGGNDQENWAAAEKFLLETA
jgi:hypothetical protein